MFQENHRRAGVVGPLMDDTYRGRTKKRHRPRKKRFGVERFYPGYGWELWKRYDTEEQRDQALVDLIKHKDGRISPYNFRKADR